MKVLQVHGTDLPRGGGAVSTYRLHFGLRKAGIDSRILCARKTLESSVEIPRLPRLESFLHRITRRIGLNDIHCVSSFNIKRNKAYLDADLLNFHCIHGGFFSYLALPSLTQSKPAVFTIRDMWPFTGHCAVSYDCERWKIGCGRCPYPEAPPSVQKDATHLEWKLKNWVYSRSNFTIVTLSHAITEQAKQSMLNRFPIYHIPNGVDTEAYQPLDVEQCRSLLGIPQGKKVLLFISVHLNSWGKGGDLLVKALESLPKSLKRETVLLLVGQDGAEAIGDSVDVQTIHLGYISGHRVKAIAYSAADVCVFPTRAEGLPNTLMESMACGTPMVSFKVGGVPDLVRTGITGYLAESGNTKDLAQGIVQLLEDETLRNQMGQRCRAIAVKEYPTQLEVQRYIQLYRKVLQQ